MRLTPQRFQRYSPTIPLHPLRSVRKILCPRGDLPSDLATGDAEQSFFALQAGKETPIQCDKSPHGAAAQKGDAS
jgi:hypothetical protein